MVAHKITFLVELPDNERIYDLLNELAQLAEKYGSFEGSFDTEIFDSEDEESASE
jgi:hypothetical protein